jgi:hypothetical protein
MLMCRQCLNTCHEMSHPQQRSNGNSSKSFPYPAIVGSLLYLAVVTRPDIMFAVGVLTHHLKSPTYASCKAACRVLNYLSHHPAISICYSGTALNLHVYTDSDWASDRDTRRSTSGGIVIMAGGPINWLSKLQPIVVVSSMEAEYIACFFAIQDIVWIRQLLKDLGLERTLPTSVHIDNKSTRLSWSIQFITSGSSTLTSSTTGSATWSRLQRSSFTMCTRMISVPTS